MFHLQVCNLRIDMWFILGFHLPSFLPSLPSFLPFPSLPFFTCFLPSFMLFLIPIVLFWSQIVFNPYCIFFLMPQPRKCYTQSLRSKTTSGASQSLSRSRSIPSRVNALLISSVWPATESTAISGEHVCQYPLKMENPQVTMGFNTKMVGFGWCGGTPMT